MSEQALNYRPIIQQLIRNADESSLREALELVGQWREEEPENPLALLHAGDLHRRVNEREPALKSFHHAAEKYASQNKMIQALAALKLALEIDPGNVVIKKYLENLFKNEAAKTKSDATPPKKPAAGETPKPVLPPTPLFSSLPLESLAQVVAQLKRRTLDDQDLVCREGEPGDSIFVLSQGRVAVRIFNSDGSFRDLATLEEGAFFGEFAYFTRQNRQLSVQALGPIEILEIERKVVEDLTRKFPDIQKVLDNFYQDRLLDSLVARSDLFRSLNQADRRAFLEKCAPVTFPPKTAVLLEGDPGDTFYFIQSGEVEVFRDRAGKKVVLARLAAGDFFGELALLTNARRTASVRTLSESRFLTLKRAQVEGILSRYPNVAAALQGVAQKRLEVIKPSRETNTKLI